MITIIINPKSGVSRGHTVDERVDVAKRVTSTLSESADIFVTERAGHGREIAADAAKRGARLVIAWGGDGTINEVASALAFTNVPLGIVPAGSGNGLAREFGISTRPALALAGAIVAELRAIDIGEINDRLFVNIAGIGFDAHIAARFGERGARRGFLGYAGITVRLLATYVPVDYRITTDTGTQTVRAILVTLANSPQFGNGARIAPGARVDDGLLDLVVFEEQSRFATICALPRLFGGSVERVRGCRIDRVREATIEAEQPMTFHVDGEPFIGGTTIRARVHPGALRVAV